MILKDLVQHYIIYIIYKYNFISIIRQNTCFVELFNTNGSTSAIFNDVGFDTDTKTENKVAHF